MQTFTILKYAHLLAFIFINASLWAKENKYFNLAQAINCILSTPIAMICTFLGIFLIKNNMMHWASPDGSKMTEVRAWILIDMYYFFSWIVSGCLFVTIAYIMKLQSQMRNDDLLILDDNPWNDKDTEDFLRHLKMEYLVFCYFVSTAYMDFIIGNDKGGGFNSGPVDFYPSKVIIGIDFTDQLISLFIFIYIGAIKGKFNEAATRVKIYILMLFNVIAFLSMSYFYFTYDKMKGQDKFYLLWCQTIIIAKAGGILYVASKLHFETKKRNELEIEITKL